MHIAIYFGTMCCITLLLYIRMMHMKGIIIIRRWYIFMSMQMHITANIGNIKDNTIRPIESVFWKNSVKHV